MMNKEYFGSLRSYRIVKKVLKDDAKGNSFALKLNLGELKRVRHCFKGKVKFHNQPHSYQVICGFWGHLPVEAVQKKDRGLGKTYWESGCED